MFVFLLVSKFFWIILIIFSFFQVSAPRWFVKQLESYYNLFNEYRELRKKILLVMNIPWIIMGVGILSGGVQTIWSYFQPRNGNPLVLLFFFSVVVMWGITLYWTFMLDGAEKVEKFHLFYFQGFGTNKQMTAGRFKFTTVAATIAGIIAIIIMFTQSSFVSPVDMFK